MRLSHCIDHIPSDGSTTSDLPVFVKNWTARSATTLQLNPQQLDELLSGRRRGPGAWTIRMLLLPASWLYALATRLRNRRFDSKARLSERVDRPVISVGNITTGGTGKTPMVEWIAKWFRASQVRVALISRGYGAEQGSRNDEAMELEERLPDVPHLQNPNRVEAARTAIDELDSQLLLLDDAFQHRRIHRDLDIVLIDALTPFGHGHVLPRGLLREPLIGLRRADVVVLSRADQVDENRRRQLKNASGQVAPIDMLNSSKTGAFCGIGNPLAFRNTVEGCLASDIAFRAFADHQAYSRDDIDALADWTESLSLNCLLCTHKDLVKIGVDSIGNRPLWALMIGLHFLAGEANLVAKLDSILNSIQPIDATD